VIRVAEQQPRALDPIVDPWVEEYETRAPAPRVAPQGDLYAERERTAPAQPQADDGYDDRDHRRSGWSLFGRGKRTQPHPESSYASQPTHTRGAAQPVQQPEPEAGQADDDLEIPSFLRRLAN
jgi:cell division protein FtsZ